MGKLSTSIGKIICYSWRVSQLNHVDRIFMSFVTNFRSAFIFLCLLFSILGYAAYQLNMSINKKDDALKHQAELRFLGEQLAKGSDYLTSEVRSYVQFGNKLHYENFWREVNKTRSRDRVCLLYTSDAADE